MDFSKITNPCSSSTSFVSKTCYVTLCDTIQTASHFFDSKEIMTVAEFESFETRYYDLDFI
jgi:hypothetical protein